MASFALPVPSIATTANPTGRQIKGIKHRPPIAINQAPTGNWPRNGTVGNLRATMDKITGGRERAGVTSVAELQFRRKEFRSRGQGQAQWSRSSYLKDDVKDGCGRDGPGIEAMEGIEQ